MLLDLGSRGKVRSRSRSSLKTTCGRGLDKVGWGEARQGGGWRWGEEVWRWGDGVGTGAADGRRMKG